MKQYMFSILVVLNRRSLLLRFKFIFMNDRFDFRNNFIWNRQAESRYEVDCRRYS